MRKTLLGFLLASVCASAYAQSTDRPVVDQNGQRKTIPSGDALLPSGLAQGAPTFTSITGAIVSRTDISQTWRYWGLSQVSYIQAAFGLSGFSATFGTLPIAGHYFLAVCSDYTSAPSRFDSSWTILGSIAGANLNVGVYGSPYMLVVEKQIVPGASATQTPCTGSGGEAVTISEVVADPINFASSLDSVTFGTQTYRSSSTVSKVTGANNELGIVAGSSADDSSGNAGTPSFSAGWLNTVGGGAGTNMGVATAQQAFASSGTNATATVAGNGGPGDWGVSSVLVLLKPGPASDYSWELMSDFWQVQNNGTPITPTAATPRTLNFNNGLIATDDGNGNETIGTNVPSCPDSGGNHLNFSSPTFSCGTSYNTSPTLTSLTITSIAGLTQCVQASAAGVLSGTGSACGAGGGGGSDAFARATILRSEGL